MTEIRNDYKEVIKQNYDSLFLRFLIYGVLSSFVLLYLLYLRINDTSPLTFWNKVLYCIIPLITLSIIVVILFMHVVYIHEQNILVISATEIKALKADEFTTVLEWEQGSGLGFNKISAYVKFQHYRFYIKFIRGDKNTHNQIQIQPTTKHITNENYWLSNVQNYTLIMYLNDWNSITHSKIMEHFTELAERLRKNNVPAEF